MKEKYIVFDEAGSARTIDSNGYMHVESTPISKAVVNPYLGSEIPGWEGYNLKPDGIYYGLRDPEELKKAAPTFNGIPLMLNHHEADAENMPKEYVIGSTGTDTEFDGTYLRSTLSITDAEAIKLIEDGEMKELSCSYSFRPEFTSGTFHGAPFDFIMRDIKGNHVALVAQGRAGHDVKVIDSKDGGESMQKKIKDADPRIEALEVENANFLRCLNAVEAQKEGIAPVDIGLDIGPDATPEDIVNQFMGEDIAPEKREKYVAILNALRGEPDTGDAGPAPAPNESAPANDAPDVNSPDYKAGYEAGIAAAKAAPNGDRFTDQPVGDSLEKVKTKIRDEMAQHFRALSKAASECKPYIGERDPLAFDSAGDIYAAALKANGYKVDGLAAGTMEAMFRVMDAERGKKQPAPVSGNKAADDMPEGLEAILARY